MDLAPGHDRYGVIEQIHERTQDAALGLAAQPEEDEIVARQDGVDELWDHRVVVAYDAGEQAFAGAELPYQVVADFLLDATGAGARSVRLPEFAQGLN